MLLWRPIFTHLILPGMSESASSGKIQQKIGRGVDWKTSQCQY